MKALYLIPLAALALFLAFVSASPDSLFAAPDQVWQFVETDRGGNRWIVDSASSDDCADWIREAPESLRVCVEKSGAETPREICAAYLDNASRTGWPEKYTLARRLCGPIY